MHEAIAWLILGIYILAALLIVGGIVNVCRWIFRGGKR